MWLANFEDGQSIGGSKCHWIDLPRKKITGVQLTSPESPKTFICLRNYDFYYFVNEAVAGPGESQGQIVAEILGGHNIELGVGTEIRMELKGSIKVRTYPLNKFSFDKKILQEGKKNGKPAIDTVPQELSTE